MTFTKLARSIAAATNVSEQSAAGTIRFYFFTRGLYAEAAWDESTRIALHDVYAATAWATKKAADDEYARLCYEGSRTR